ncbi:restriction endonuclease subunit S [Paucibacter aquatile]|uniref:Restriction endonuclease subunit S n=1 Tax=Kinneretia aquatilis TaxID=2070761 RepID=A0A2N8KZC2_9BURK|nr:restriction endonuclease subunit S [Paucibacter aquatile]PND38808.1 restriction endonuclease subunit S [Paucibacter aquatile]
MSSKNQTTSAEDQARHALAPKLRFSGFSAPWTFEPIAKVLKEHKLKNTAGRDVFSVSMEFGVVNQIELLGRSFAAADTSHYTIGRRYDIVYTKSPLKAFPFGIVKQCKFDGEVALSPLYGVFTPTNPHLGLLIEAYFESPNRANSFLSPLCQKGAKNTLQITNATFLSGRLPLPAPPLEQQKIAECLSSVDDLIAAQARKVDVLKTHKKGLMQQLFPREGETQPRLRFPEFRNACEWQQKKLGSVCDIQRGKFSHRPRNDPRFFGGQYPFIQTGDVVKSEGGTVIASQSLNEEGLAVSKLFKPTIVLITIAANIGDTGLLQTEGCFTDSVVGLIPKSDVIPVFLELIMRGQKENLNKVATTGAQKNINNEILRDVRVLLPSVPEQQRIASCLSSLDAQITAETQKLEALKTHKKGLMQQLFPSPEEADA